MIRDDYEMVIGLEVHCELSTKTKIFCSCPTEFGGEPNTHCCPVCMAMPGALPVLNEKVVEYAVKAGLATNCTISQDSKNDSKRIISYLDTNDCDYIDIREDDSELDEVYNSKLNQIKYDVPLKYMLLIPFVSIILFCIITFIVLKLTIK